MGERKRKGEGETQRGCKENGKWKRSNARMDEWKEGGIEEKEEGRKKGRRKETGNGEGRKEGTWINQYSIQSRGQRRGRGQQTKGRLALWTVVVTKGKKQITVGVETVQLQVKASARTCVHVDNETLQ